MKKLSELFKKYRVILFAIAVSSGGTGVVIYNAASSAVDLHDKTRAELKQAKADNTSEQAATND